MWVPFSKLLLQRTARHPCGLVVDSKRVSFTHRETPVVISREGYLLAYPHRTERTRPTKKESQTSPSQNSRPTRSGLQLPDHVTGDFGLNFELPSCLACFLTVSSAVLQSHWISGSNRFLSGEGTLQRYLYAPSCMYAFPFTNKIKLLRTEISLFYPDTFFLLFFYVFQQFAIFYQEFAFQNSPGSIHPPLHPNLSKIDTSLSNKPETYVLFPKPHLCCAFIVWCLCCKSHYWKKSHISGGGTALLEWKSCSIGPYISLVPFKENRFFFSHNISWLYFSLHPLLPVLPHILSDPDPPPFPASD